MKNVHCVMLNDGFVVAKQQKKQLFPGDFGLFSGFGGLFADAEFGEYATQ